MFWRCRAAVPPQPASGTKFSKVPLLMPPWQRMVQLVTSHSAKPVPRSQMTEELVGQGRLLHPLVSWMHIENCFGTIV